jgi:glycine/D-amino acid oxidase-like deaminating enzyme/nitrite reductase/ring-hydroxylating ferredoxin subunit
MIRRDGTCISLWQDSVDEYYSLNRPQKNFLYDVIIVGGGITGISTGLLLQKAGKKCLIVEAANIGFGTTGGTTAHLNTLLDTPYTTIQKKFGKEDAKLVAKSVKEAIRLIYNNINEYRIDCGFSFANAFLFAKDEKQEKELDEIYEASVAAGIDIGYSDNITVPIDFVKAVKVGGQGKFHPLKYVYGLANEFEKMGGVILQKCRVTNIEKNDTITAETEKGNFRANDLIYATHIPPGVNLLHLRCVPYRSYAIAMTLNDNAYPADLAYDMYDPYHYYRTQRVNGRNYLIAGGEDHKTGHEENTEYSFLKLESHIRQYFSVKEIVYKWSSQYFEPADGIPYIGHLPGSPENIYVATGFGGNGMVYSSVAALVFKEILLNEEKKYADLFDPNRIKPIAGFTNFIKHNADVAKLFVSKLFSGEDLHELAELAPGEAKIVVYNKNKIALYKDEEGQLHAINPICTHLKCEVKWNMAEKTWDCPCHGARYSFDGKLLTGPASHDLESIQLGSLIKK